MVEGRRLCERWLDGSAKWDAYFGPLGPGRFYERALLLRDALGRHYRRSY